MAAAPKPEETPRPKPEPPKTGYHIADILGRHSDHTPRHEISSVLSKRQGDATKAGARTEVVSALFKEMFRISGDPSGSDPADYFPPGDAERIKEFVLLARSKGWPNAAV